MAGSRSVKGKTVDEHLVSQKGRLVRRYHATGDMLEGSGTAWSAPTNHRLDN